MKEEKYCSIYEDESRDHSYITVCSSANRTHTQAAMNTDMKLTHIKLCGLGEIGKLNKVLFFCI